MLDSGITVIAEDYAGTGMMWGMADGIDRDFLIYTNSHLIQPDLVLLFHGQRFTDGIEKNHKYEQDNQLTDRAAAAAEELAELLHWKRIFANGSKQEITERVWHEVLPLLNEDSS